MPHDICTANNNEDEMTIESSLFSQIAQMVTIGKLVTPLARTLRPDEEMAYGTGDLFSDSEEGGYDCFDRISLVANNDPPEGWFSCGDAMSRGFEHDQKVREFMHR